MNYFIILLDNVAPLLKEKYLTIPRVNQVYRAIVEDKTPIPSTFEAINVKKHQD